VEHRAFPLRPVPDPGIRFQGTYRQNAWQRCNQMSAGDGIVFTPWPRVDYPNCSMPALEAAKCAAKQGDDVFARLHLRLYEAFFTRSVNIAEPAELEPVVAEAGVDVARFTADFRAGTGRAAVIADYEAAVNEHGVRSIPTVIVPATGRALVGLVDLEQYRRAVSEAT
jgi:predicted DsbA family dithiol-disulfide isomerase